MKISLFVHDLSKNPIGRAYPIAKALQRLGHEVEILGFLIKGNNIYRPYRGGLFYRYIKVPDSFIHVLLQSPILAKMASGDIIYAFKPLWTSFFPALLASGEGRKKPLLLDIDDDELWVHFRGVHWFVAKHLLWGWNNHRSWHYKLLLDRYARACTRKTLMSQKMKRRYGGEILLHGPDESIFDPNRQDLDRYHCRELLGLPFDVPLALFVGTPMPYKGLDKVVAAFQESPALNYHLILVGDKTHPIYQAAYASLGKRCHIYDYMSNEQMPALLTAVDVVPIIQQFHGVAEAQTPAKLLEAMAMEKAIVASWVADLPEILGEKEQFPRGWLTSPTDVTALAQLLGYIENHPKQARERGKAARNYFMEHASTGILSGKLAQILKSCTPQGGIF